MYHYITGKHLGNVRLLFIVMEALNVLDVAVFRDRTVPFEGLSDVEFKKDYQFSNAVFS